MRPGDNKCLLQPHYLYSRRLKYVPDGTQIKHSVPQNCSRLGTKGTKAKEPATTFVAIGGGELAEASAALDLILEHLHKISDPPLVVMT